MEEIRGVVEISQPENVTVKEAAAAAAHPDITHALIVESGRPTVLISTASLENLGERPLAQVTHEAPVLDQQAWTIELPDGYEYRVVMLVHGDVGVIDDTNSRFVVDLDGQSPAQALSHRSATAFHAVSFNAMADIFLPGPDVPVDPQNVTYECELGHLVRQRSDDPNRMCWCTRPLERS